MVPLETHSALLDPMFIESRPLDDIWLQVIINFGNELESQGLERVSKHHS